MARSATRPAELSDRVRIVGNQGSCGDPGHLFCWQIQCRACGACLREHADVAAIRQVAPDLLATHHCRA